MKLRQSLFIVSLCVLFSFSVYGQIDNTKIYFLIRCDDMGMCHTLNMAIEKVIERGIPFSTSAMFACPWHQEAVDILKMHPDVGVGVHLTLNAEWKN